MDAMERRRLLERVFVWFRYRLTIPLAMVVLAIAVAVDSYFIHQNTVSISQLEANAAITAAYQQQQAVIFNQFLSEFVTEQNYLCRIAAARAATDRLEPAPPGVCNVSLAPRALPTPSG